MRLPTRVGTSSPIGARVEGATVATPTAAMDNGHALPWASGSGIVLTRIAFVAASFPAEEEESDIGLMI